MANKKKKSLLYPAIFMIILTAILTFLLALMNSYTRPLVAQNQELELKTKILNIFSVDTNVDPDVIHSEFDQSVKELDKTYNDKPIYVYEKDGNIQGYAIALDGPGVWGPIEAYAGLSQDLSEILGIEFISQSETPGLGARIEEDFYKNQYRNIPVNSVREEIDGISGATGTSTSVINLVTEDIATFLETEGGAN